MIEWKWFCIMWGTMGGWGLGFDISVAKDYAYVRARILKWDLTLQWEKDVEYVRG